MTRAIAAICRRRHWTTYDKLIERGSVRTVPLARALFALVQSVLPSQTLSLVIDDTLVPRCSSSAPGCAIRHDHARKTNRPEYPLSQCWVTLGVSVLGPVQAKLVLPGLVAALPATPLSLFLYGKEQTVRPRSVVALARFLKATPVCALWCEFFDPDKNTWSKPRLLLATETELTAETVVRLYARRWGIEPLFHNLKRWWGVANLWQQSRKALEL